MKPLQSATFDEALQSTGFPLLALDLRALPALGPVRAWFDAPQGTFNTGAVFSDAWWDDDATTPTHFLEIYDGLFFVARTTAARPNHIRKE